MSDNTIEPDTYMGLAQQYIKNEISDEEFTNRSNHMSIFKRGTKMNRKEIKRRVKC